MKTRLFASVVLGGALLLAAAPADAVTNLVTNGDFAMNAGDGQLGFNTSATGWSVANPATYGSYVFLYNPNTAPIGPGNLSGTTADESGSLGQFGTVKLWGPDDGSANGLDANPTGAFIASTPTFDNGPISQTVTGLTPGNKYVLTFNWAAGQQQGFDGTTTEGWKVTFGGGASQSTSIITLPDKGFSGWMTQSFTFTADNTSDQLTFLAIDAPGTTDEQGFSLLNGVLLSAPGGGGPPVPEPAAWTLMVVGVGSLGAALRLRRRTVVAA
jgi:hypothetical protein